MPSSTLTMYDVAVPNGHSQRTLFSRVSGSQSILDERAHIDPIAVVWINYYC